MRELILFHSSVGHKGFEDRWRKNENVAKAFGEVLLIRAITAVSTANAAAASGPKAFLDIHYSTLMGKTVPRYLALYQRWVN